MWRSWVRAPPKAPVVSVSKKLYPYCLVLVDSRNGFEIHNRTKKIEGLMEDLLKIQIRPLSTHICTRTYTHARTHTHTHTHTLYHHIP